MRFTEAKSDFGNMVCSAAYILRSDTTLGNVLHKISRDFWQCVAQNLIQLYDFVQHASQNLMQLWAGMQDDMHFPGLAQTCQTRLISTSERDHLCRMP